MAKIGLPKGSGKRLKVREKSVKSQGILKWILSGNPVTNLVISFSIIFQTIGNRKWFCIISKLADIWVFLNSYTIMFNFRYLKTYAAISNAHLSRVCKQGKLSGSCLLTLNGFGSTQLQIFLCHIGVPTFSSQNN